MTTSTSQTAKYRVLFLLPLVVAFSERCFLGGKAGNELWLGEGLGGKNGRI